MHVFSSQNVILHPRRNHYSLGWRGYYLKCSLAGWHSRDCIPLSMVQDRRQRGEMQGPLDNKVSVMKPTTVPEKTDIELPFKFHFTLEVIVLTKFSQLQNPHQLLYKRRKIKGQVFVRLLKKKKRIKLENLHIWHIKSEVPDGSGMIIDGIRWAG